MTERSGARTSELSRTDMGSWRRETVGLEVYGGRAQCLRRGRWSCRLGATDNTIASGTLAYTLNLCPGRSLGFV
jgi:hypothetical protein